jgi:hypothetical protein
MRNKSSGGSAMHPNQKLTSAFIAGAFAFFMAGALIKGPSAFAREALMPGDAAAASPAAGFARAFGRVVFLAEGKEQAFGLFSPLSLFIWSAKTDEVQRMKFLEDGSFYLALKPGEYTIAAFLYSGSTGRLWLTFSVPEPGQAVYVGDVRLSVDKSRYAFSIVDNYPEALKKVEERLAEGRIEPMRALIRAEGPLGTSKRTLGICAKDWGIGCGRTYQGVEPLLPEGTTEAFPVISSRTPVLEWRPSKAQGVSYDVAIYESVTLAGIAGLPGARRQRGKLAAYMEGLEEPRFEVSTPLLPDKQYMWSVRLRSGDTVSTWSASSYFAFFIVGYSRGSGAWFGFSTPDK